MTLMNGSRRRAQVLAPSIDVCTWSGVLSQIVQWAQQRESRYVCICNAHSVVTATQDQDFLNVLNSADLATPDGAPVAWMLRRQGHEDQERISGPDLMLHACEVASNSGVSVFFYGGSPESLQLLQANIIERFPNLKIAGAMSPPFRQLSEVEDEAVVEEINRSGAGIAWVGLGCPKQEAWMHAHRGRVHAVMVGVGAAFDFHAGRIKRAPSWMQRAGLEWLHRLLSEPRRLWRRYLVTNTLFILGATRQLIRQASSGR
ncbi:MAG: glycosyltransferase [Ramlibacter sp.]|nr:glycosyltransferase [Ramlibacter sp.]